MVWLNAADAVYCEGRGNMIEMIKKNREFKMIYNQGKSIADSNLVLYCRPSENRRRFGITVSSKVGNSVVRNKIKRQIKEILRINDAVISDGYDIIFVVRVRCKHADFNKIKESVFHLLRKSNLLLSAADFV